MAEGERLLKVAKQGRIVAALDRHCGLTTARGLKNFREDMVDASYESDRLGEHATRGKRDKARRGKSNASHRGFAMEGYLPNPDGWIRRSATRSPPSSLAAEREAVRELARRLLAGQSWAEMVRYLNGTGLRTTYGNDWSVTSMRAMLRRPSLAGMISHSGAEVGTLPGELVLDRDTWERCQSVMASRTPGPETIEWVPADGPAHLWAVWAPAHRDGLESNCAPYEDGKPARQYWCQRHPGRGSGWGG